MRIRVFRSMLFAVIMAITLSGTLGVMAFYGFMDSYVHESIRQESEYVAAALNAVDDRVGYLESVRNNELRISLFDAAGTPLYDSEFPIDEVMNAYDDTCFRSAQSLRIGDAKVVSAETGERVSCYTVRLNDGSIVRLQVGRDEISAMLMSVIWLFVGIFAIVAALALMLTRRMSKKVFAPINDINLDEPMKNEGYDELSPLLSRMEKQRKRINRQMTELTKQQSALSAVTANMREGLVVLDKNNNILSINASALKIFRMQEEKCVGKHILTLNRSENLRDMLINAGQGIEVEEMIHFGGRSYRITANQVDGETGEQAGMVLLVLDVTERHNAEKLRREFTANVSHELKTPLTSIAGYAEIMANGIVRQEDMQSFAGRIHEESTRLIELVHDILKLSKLDEKSGELEWEDVLLGNIAADAVNRLTHIAEDKSIALALEGEAPAIKGVRPVLHEMVYNLIENAIKYTPEKGRVKVTISHTDKLAIVRVKDTGVGIPQQYHDKVFERFYRVDQSHNKQTGGTGLGLSIVKHGAILHGASLTLESQEGKGTKVTLEFRL